MEGYLTEARSPCLDLLVGMALAEGNDNGTDFHFPRRHHRIDRLIDERHSQARWELFRVPNPRSAGSPTAG